MVSNEFNLIAKTNRHQTSTEIKKRSLEEQVPPKKDNPTTEDRVSLSKTENAAVSSNADVRRELVEKYKNYLKNGTYVVKAKEIADKMVQKITDNKNSVII